MYIFRHLLSELDRNELSQFYLWLTQQFHHTLTSSRTRVDSRTPAWPPVLFFHPSDHQKWKPGVYFEYIPNFDFTMRDLGYIFNPLLEYLRCLVSGCPTLSVSYSHFLDSRVGPVLLHPHHPGEEDFWLVAPSQSSNPDPGDRLCDLACRLCSSWSLAHI